MCGRYQLADDQDIEEVEKIIEQVEKNIKADSLTEKPYKTGEIYPSNIVPVFAKESIRLMSWGFPKWNGKGLIINARGETAAEKSMFGKALRERRCVIPSTGFFEWSRVSGKVKDKYIFNVPGERMLYMAGLTSNDAFVILTRAANEYMAIHDRMPVILSREEIDSWLFEDPFVEELLKRDSTALESRVVS